MPTDVTRAGLDRLLEQGAQLIEVLPPAEYAEDHLPGAISIPLKTLRPDTVSALRRDVPVVTYCWDGI